MSSPTSGSGKKRRVVSGCNSSPTIAAISSNQQASVVTSSRQLFDACRSGDLSKVSLLQKYNYNMRYVNLLILILV